MDPRLQRRIQRYGWDKAVPCYEPFWARQIAPAQQKLLELAALRPGEAVLDTACGTGLVSFIAGQAVGPAGRVVGTDISQKMVDACRAEAARRGAENVRFERMDAEHLGLPDGAFDAALCSLGMMYVPDPLRAAAELRRVLRPGGRAVSAVWGARACCGWAEIFPIVDSRVRTEVCPMFFHLGTGDTQAHVFARAGFTGVRSERLNVTLHYESAEEALGAAFDGGPVALACSRFDEATRQAARAEYLASIEPYRDGAAYHIPGEFVVTLGFRR